MARHQMITFLLFFLGFAGTISAQTQGPRAEPELGGTWRLVESSNDRFGVAGSPNSAKNSCWRKISIQQKLPKIVITRTTGCSRKPNFAESIDLMAWAGDGTYYSDGRGESNLFGEKAKVASETHWQKGALIIEQFEIKMKSGKETRDRQSFQTVKLELQKDGKRLNETITSVGGGPINSPAMVTRNIYSR